MGNARLTQQGQSRLQNAERRSDIRPVRTGDRVLSPEMGTEELVSTIEQVEPHDTDPKTEDERDPWESVTSDFSDISHRLRDTYRKIADDRGPSEDEIKEAFATLVGAWDQVAESVTTALSDPELRQQIKDAAGSFASAVGSTITDLGAELRKEPGQDEEE